LLHPLPLFLLINILFSNIVKTVQFLSEGSGVLRNGLGDVLREYGPCLANRGYFEDNKSTFAPSFSLNIKGPNTAVIEDSIQEQGQLTNNQ
jgi:hypothetical protein